ATQDSPGRGRGQEGPAPGEEEHLPRPRAHQEHVQQHDRLHHRPDRQRHQLGVGRSRGLQGLAQVDAVRGADGRGELRPQGRRARHEEGRRLRQGPGLGPRDGDPLAAGRGPRGRDDLRRHPAAAQRLPPAEASPGL
ncbi:MAG: SSU ribosomal protein S11p (S14e), partial [uncultured Actinomycetospora sp.]